MIFWFALSFLFLWLLLHAALLLAPVIFLDQAADLDDQAGAGARCQRPGRGLRRMKYIFCLFIKTQWVIWSAHHRANGWAAYRTLRTLDPHSVCVMKALDGSHCVWVENRVTGESKYFLHLHGKRRGQHINQVKQ